MFLKFNRIQCEKVFFLHVLACLNVWIFYVKTDSYIYIFNVIIKLNE